MKRLACRIAVNKSFSVATKRQKTLTLKHQYEKTMRANIPTVLTQTYLTNLGITVTVSYWLHDYRAAGSSEPLYAATCSTEAFI